MSFRTNRAPEKVSLKGIPTGRRHAYFYALLLLGTVVVHNLWNTTENTAVRSATDQAHAVVATASHLIP